MKYTLLKILVDCKKYAEMRIVVKARLSTSKRVGDQRDRLEIMISVHPKFTIKAQVNM